MIPVYTTNPVQPQRHPRNTVPEEGLSRSSASRYGEFKHAVPGFPNSMSGGPPDQVARPQRNAWKGTYTFHRPGPGYFPLQSTQPVVPPVQWNASQSFNNVDVGRSRQVAEPHEYYNSAQPHDYEPDYSHQYNGQPQEEYRGQFQQGQDVGGQTSFHGHPQLYPESGPITISSGGLNVLSEPVRPDSPDWQSHGPAPVPSRNRLNTEDLVQPVHTWITAEECPQPSGTYVPPPLPPLDFDLVVEIGDTVRIRPWDDQYTWIEGRVEKADLSVIKHHKPFPRYIVSYRDPSSNHLRQRTFFPHLSEITVREPDEAGARPLPEGIDRNVYACVPPPITHNGAPIEKIWAHARVLTPPDENARINIRVLVGPSKNILFDNFPLNSTLPYRRSSRVRLGKLGYAVAGKDEHASH